MPINKFTKRWVGPSVSEHYMQSKSNTPQISAMMANSVSKERKELMAAEIEAGFYSDGSAGNSKQFDSGVGNVISSVKFFKNAQVINSAGNMYKGGMGDTVKQTPEVYSPLWLNSNINLPRDRATTNAWSRSFYALNPFVHNAINLHSTYPISKLNIKCPNKEIERFFNDMIEEIDLMNICVQIAQEYWLLGEAFVYAELDQTQGKWSRLVIQNPDYMIVKRTVVANEPIIMMRPDQNLKDIILSNKPSDIEQRKQLNDHIIESVKRGNNIPLDNFHVSHLSRKVSPYEIRGTGLPVCIFRNLMLMDKLRESKFAQADNLINPMTLVKIGTPGADGFKPQLADLEAYRETFEMAQNDKDFKIFTHDGVSVEKIGSGAGIYDISGDITQLIKEIYVGLQVPSVLMDGGSDVTYSNGGIALDVLRQRYTQFRNMLSTWLKRKIFAPISKLQGFYDYSGGEKQLIVPEIDWNHMSLFDVGDYLGILKELTQTQGENDQKRVSLHTLYRSLGLEFEDEQRKLRKEAIQSVITQKEKAALMAMDLNSVRSLDEEDEIPEISAAGKPAEAPLPGEAPGGMPGMGGGDLPGSGGAPPPPAEPPK